MHWEDVREKLKKNGEPLFDLRSEKEFTLGHIPGALNLPLLNNEERHEVGKLYKEEGKSLAVARGLEIFSQKAEDFLKKIEKRVRTQSLTLYCWRGGMRSGLMAQWLTLAGYDVTVLKGGYKNFRRDVLLRLEQLAEHPKLVLNGRTGSGKTEFLAHIQQLGYPAIDLEHLARHRGSTFGGIAQKESCPSQQNFENTLYEAYLDYKTSPCILFEIENFIGPVCVPQRVRESLQKSPMIFLTRNFEDRVSLLERTYCEGWNDETEKEFFIRLPLLRKYISLQEEQNILRAIQKKDFSYAISQLLRLRYDRVYDKSLSRHQQQALAHFNLSCEETLAVEFVKRALS
jgi:tRNA 2-selenouridine synthase